MKILSITAGAGGMYCGSCLRDNALATELRSLGHDVLLMPVYTPTLTDEPNVSEPQLLFGGISVYLQQSLPLFRKTPRWLDRLWDSSLVMKLATHFSVPTDPSHLGELTVSMLRGEDGFQRKEFLKLVDWLKEHPAPDIINLPNSLLISMAKPIKEIWDRPVCCTLQGEDLFLEGLSEPYRSQSIELIQRNVQWVDGFVSVSDYYARYMSERLRLPWEKMHVVPLGIHTHGLEPPPRTDRAYFTIGYFARIAPEKGLHDLVEAYRVLRQRKDLPPLRLEAAGYMGREHRGYLEGTLQRMRDWGLDGEFRYHGTVDRDTKTQFLRNLDVLSVPSGYKEPKGLYLLEAMACGVPVVQPRHGAFPEIIERTGGGLLVEPGDAQSLADGIAAIATDPGLARRLSEQGPKGVRAHYDARRMASRTVEVYQAICDRRQTEGLARQTGGDNDMNLDENVIHEADG